jgi:hypothetical protein
LGSQIIINAMKNDLKEEGRKPQNYFSWWEGQVQTPQVGASLPGSRTSKEESAVGVE